MTNTLWSLHSKKWIQMSFKCQNENKSQNNITEKLHELFLIYYACFPLNLSWAKLFFFPSRWFFHLSHLGCFKFISRPPCPFWLCHWGRQLSVGDAWAGSPKQICGDAIAKRHRGAQCADSACVGKEGWRERRSDAGRDKTVSMQQPKYLQHSSVTEGRLCLNRLTRLVSILDAKTKQRHTSGRFDFNW